MRSHLFIIACLGVCQLYAQPKLTVGQYAYIRAKQPFYISPVIQYQSSRNWYAEARYNYEDQQTFSLYAGRSFLKDRRISYTITPMIGLMMGRLEGGAAGLNAELNVKDIYFSTQSQYCVSSHDRMENFFFSWSEAGYQLFEGLNTGLSFQYTKGYQAEALPEPGIFACFSFRQWSFPVYYFLPAHGASFFVAGITREWSHPGRTGTKNGKPPFPKRNQGAGY